MADARDARATQVSDLVKQMRLANPVATIYMGIYRSVARSAAVS